jgi:hypothetical protein
MSTCNLHDSDHFAVTNIKISFLAPFPINIYDIKILNNVYHTYANSKIFIVNGIFGVAPILGG